jgi:dTDP-4-dehydrorhamnose 3,5-epimerase
MSFNFKIYNDKKLKGVKIIENSFFEDKRGYLYTNFNQKIKNTILKKRFNNFDDKIIYRKKNSLTGIHGDNKTWKIISCLSGKIELVLVNCRKNSKNFGKYTKFNLRGMDFKSILIPPLIGNSYLCLSKTAIISYKFFYNGKYNDFNNQFTYSWKDKRFNINWSIKKKLILSERDNI